MSFERLYQEIREKIGDDGQDLYNKDLLKKIHSYTIDYKWDFDKEDAKKEAITVEMATEEKDKGTKFFRSNQLQEACETYTNYINMCHRITDHADLFKSKMVYQGYANRYLLRVKSF